MSLCTGSALDRGAVTAEDHPRRVGVQRDVLGGGQIHTHRARETFAPRRVGPLALAPVEGGLGGGCRWRGGCGRRSRQGGEGVGWVAAAGLHRVVAAVDSAAATPRHTLLSAVLHRPVSSQTSQYSLKIILKYKVYFNFYYMGQNTLKQNLIPP